MTADSFKAGLRWGLLALAAGKVILAEVVVVSRPQPDVIPPVAFYFCAVAAALALIALNLSSDRR